MQSLMRTVSSLPWNWMGPGSHQFIVFGHLPLVFEVAGSRVAFAHASVSARPMNERNSILRLGVEGKE